ncbi:MAG: basic amino acid ABC transporter substrate-binding protein [Lentisphaeria bacterium]
MFAKKFTTGLLAAATLFLTSCGNNDGKLKVGTEPTFPPFEMTDVKTGEIIGFDIDLIKAIAADQGLEVVFVNSGFDALIPSLQTGSLDIAASGISITDERKKNVDFSAPYINAGLAITVKFDNTKINSVDDLKDCVVAVQIGSTGAEEANKLLKDNKIKSVKTFENVAIAMTDLNNGGVDAVINDLPVSEAYVARHKNKLRNLSGTLTSDSYGFAVRKGNKELLDKINAGLKNIEENGTINQIKAKYFGN